MGDLAAPSVGARTAIGLEDKIHPVDHVQLTCIRRQGDGQIVEPALHVKCRAQGVPGHPDHAEAEVVREYGSGALDLVDVFGRQAYADDAKRFLPAVYDRADPVVGRQPIGFREGFADDDLLRPSDRRIAALLDRHVVEHRPASFGHGDQPACSGFIQAGHVQVHIHHDPGAHAGNAGDPGDFLLGGRRRPFDAGEYIGEPVTRVVGFLGLEQGDIGVARGDVEHDTAGHHQGDGDDLAAHAGQFAEHLAVQDGHGCYAPRNAGYQLNSSGRFFA